MKNRIPVVAALTLAAVLCLSLTAAGQDTTDLYNSGLEHVRAQRWQQAADVLKQAAAKDPKDADVQFQLGYTYYQLKQYAEAVTHLKQATALRAGDYEATHWLGRSHFAL